MADYYVTDARVMAAALEKYKSKCHKTIKHRPRTFVALSRLNKKALRQFDDIQKGLIAEAPDLWKDFSNGKIGKSITGTEVKSAFRAFIASEQGNLCCYCQRWLLNNGNAKPIEHILPRESFKHFSFNFWNLAVACVDCNGLKSADVWVGGDKLTVRDYPAPSSFTEMYHPRFHRFKDHVRFVRVQTNEHNITLYRGITSQGRKLCHDLLQDIAAKEVLINGNPRVKASLATINQFEPAEGSALEKALLELQDAFSAAAMKLVRPKD